MHIKHFMSAVVFMRFARNTFVHLGLLLLIELIQTEFLLFFRSAVFCVSLPCIMQKPERNYMLSVEMISRQNRCHYVYKGGNMMRRILHIVLITALMFLNVMYTCEAVKAAEPQQPISIEKAIQQKEGQALVEGYAVGQAVSPQHYKLTSPFSNDYNVALADRKNETSPEHILPVQIPPPSEANLGCKPIRFFLGKR